MRNDMSADASGNVARGERILQTSDKKQDRLIRQGKEDRWLSVSRAIEPVSAAAAGNVAGGKSRTQNIDKRQDTKNPCYPPLSSRCCSRGQEKLSNITKQTR